MILAIFFAVIASMTMHHAAMARSDVHDHIAVAAHSHAESHCQKSCVADGHALQGCCSIGLCLSGIPVAPVAASPLAEGLDLVSDLQHAAPRWLNWRIDRPPKIVLELV